MIDLLRDNPLLLLFVVAAIGYPIGRITVAGVSLGVAAVLFAGLAVGALDPDLQLPEIIYNLGLVLFVYTIGLSSGRGFFSALRRRGPRDNLFAAGVLAFAAVLSTGAYVLLDLSAAHTAGLFAGSVTNTPALAAVLDYLRLNPPPGPIDQILAEPVVAYSVTYPMGVVGVILAILLVRRLWRIDYATEARAMPDLPAVESRLTNRTIRVTRPEATDVPIATLVQRHGWDVVFGRYRHGQETRLVTADTLLAPGDLITAVGTEEELERVTAALGETSNEQLDLARHELDFRRIFVSNPKVVGHRLRDLNLPQQFGAVITRVRRGDVDFLPSGDTVLEPGDRVRVVTARSNMDAVSRFLGDSYRALSEIDILTFGLGLALGLLLGLVPIPLPGGLSFTLGLAGGPLIVALVLGSLERTGPLVWSLPYSANLTIRQMGLIFFLAGVGTRAGHPFVTTIVERSGLLLFAAGVVVTTTTAFLALWVGYRLLRIPMGVLIGMVAGIHTQPAVLGFALEQTDNELPNVGYAAVYPIATVAKIVLAQVLLMVLIR
ncbi:aspartate:alanine exchanger family transporter [Sphaerobacter thermophilus]|uniref:YidE/YbjL duplication n=1 Tax=Sphaerobacter thermophilus (strain ATCC 49802 / DSM 20745 / KCCM 41009 / NCIMB 13125 / S 6022) TaxID=479434 RepID=D1C9R9_SPHTD|nr:aspartate:alanine exchanger family transporter [Sphaerobacter thermophilus]ACZ40562.1 YidE/YbjL duplication [Sphaerobacter thermophilus DSM 20745]